MATGISRAWGWVKKRYHFLLAGTWLALAAPSMLWWSTSVAFVILLSLYANFESSMAADEGKRDRGEMKKMAAEIERIIDFLGVDRVVPPPD